MAIIYKKESFRPLSKYQLKMNNAAIHLCLQNPGLLRKKRKILMDAARDKIIADGFQFAKGKSRSKSLTPEAAEPKPKRQKLTQDVREKRLKDVEEDMSDLKEQIQFKERRISGYLAVSDYKKCDEIKEETIQLKKQLRELEAEKSDLLHLAVSRSGIIRTNVLQVIRVLIIQLHHAVTLIYRVVLQHQLQVLCQIPLSVNRFLLLVHLILYPLSFRQVSSPYFHNLNLPMVMLIRLISKAMMVMCKLLLKHQMVMVDLPIC